MSKEWDEQNPEARRYLDERELMRIDLETDHGTFEAVFYHDPLVPDEGAYTAAVNEKHAIVQGGSVAECIDELHKSIDFMVMIEREEKSG